MLTSFNTSYYILGTNKHDTLVHTHDGMVGLVCPNGLTRLPGLPHGLAQMCHCHPRLKHQTEWLLVRYNPRYERRVVDRPFGVFGDRKPPKDGRRCDIQRSTTGIADNESLVRQVPPQIRVARPGHHVDMETRTRRMV